MSENKVIWHKYPDEKPKNNCDIPYLVTCLFDGFSRKEFIVDMFYYEEDSFKWNPQNDVIAWAELPEPYNPEEDKND